jgi:hypothetical protein
MSDQAKQPPAPQPRDRPSAKPERIDTDGDGRTRDRTDNGPNADVVRGSGKPPGGLQP